MTRDADERGLLTYASSLKKQYAKSLDKTTEYILLGLVVRALDTIARSGGKTVFTTRNSNDIAMYLKIIKPRLKRTIMLVKWSGLGVLLIWILSVVAWNVKIQIGDNVPVPGIWASPCAVTSDTDYDPLPDMSGHEIGLPYNIFSGWCAFTVFNRSLVYWSTKDMSVCIATPEGGSRWYSARRWITESTDVCSLFSSRKYIYLNIRGQFGATQVLRLVPKTGQLSPVPGVIAVRAHDSSSEVVALRKDGSIQFLTDDHIAISTRLYVGHVVDWDGDTDAKMVCWRVGNRIRTWQNGRYSSFGIDVKRYRGMSLYTAKHIIWVSSDYDGPAIMAADALVYRYDGSYLGSHLFCSMPANSPMYPYDPVVIKIAHRLSTIRKSIAD